MKRFKCVNCKFKIKTDELHEDYKCPKCGAPKAAFIEEERRSLILIILYLLTIITLLIAGSFTISSIIDFNKIDEHKVQIGKVSMKLIGQNDTNIRLVNSYPMSDEKAATLSPFRFQIENNGTYKIEYRIKLVNVPNNQLVGVEEIVGKDRIDNKYVRYSLIDADTDKVLKTGLVSELKDEIIIESKLEASKLQDFEFRVWVDKDASNDAQNKFYAGRLVLEVNQLESK